MMMDNGLIFSVIDFRKENKVNHPPAKASRTSTTSKPEGSSCNKAEPDHVIVSSKPMKI